VHTHKFSEIRLQLFSAYCVDNFGKEKTMVVNMRRTPWYLWPFAATWNLVVWIVSLTGRLVAVLLGLALLMVGVILTGLIITSPIGIPLIGFGLLLVVRGLW
jgi:hypothetical protein